MNGKAKDCKGIATKWRKSQVIIIGIDERGNWDLVVFGQKSGELPAFGELVHTLSNALANRKPHPPPNNWFHTSARKGKKG